MDQCLIKIPVLNVQMTMVYSFLVNVAGYVDLQTQAFSRVRVTLKLEGQGEDLIFGFVSVRQMQTGSKVTHVKPNTSTCAKPVLRWWLQT